MAKPRKREKPPTPQDYAAGKDPANGRFVPGNPGGPGGRVARPDLFMVVRRMAAKEGIDVDAWLWELVKALRKMALGTKKSGDVAAAKQILDRLTNPDPVEINVNDGTVLSDAERAAKIEQILAVARERKAKQDEGSAP